MFLHLGILLKTDLFSCLWFRCCIQSLYCSFLFSGVGMSLVNFSFINEFFLPINPSAFFNSVLICLFIFTSVLKCCVLCLKKLQSTTVTAAFQEWDFLFFLVYNFQSCLKIREIQLAFFLQHPHDYKCYVEMIQSLFPCPKDFSIIFKSSLASGISKQYGTHAEEAFCSNYFL